jgi:imidazolonepropionase-like amidohydrolase
MRFKRPIIIVLAITIWQLAGSPAPAQDARKYITPHDQVVVVRAGHLFDARAGKMLDNQLISIKGDRISTVGPDAQIPAGARVIDLSAMYVLPGMIDSHVHVNTGGSTPAQRALIALANAQADLDAGFTTVLDMDSRGGFNTVDLRDAINSGMVQGPRMPFAAIPAA